MTDTSVNTTFDTARQGLRELGGSSWEYDLVERLARHCEDEGAILAEYQRLTGADAPAAARYLGQLIIDDEQRHHRILAELANAIGWGISRLSPEPTVPPLPAGGKADPALVAAIRALLELEQHDHKGLTKLRKELHSVADTTLWVLLIDVMLLDTEKHTRILRFLLNHLDGK